MHSISFFAHAKMNVLILLAKPHDERRLFSSWNNDKMNWKRITWNFNGSEPVYFDKFLPRKAKQQLQRNRRRRRRSRKNRANQIKMAYVWLDRETQTQTQNTKSKDHQEWANKRSWKLIFILRKRKENDEKEEEEAAEIYEKEGRKRTKRSNQHSIESVDRTLLHRFIGTMCVCVCVCGKWSQWNRV